MTKADCNADALHLERATVIKKTIALSRGHKHYRPDDDDHRYLGISGENGESLTWDSSSFVKVRSGCLQVRFTAEEEKRLLLFGSNSV